MPTKLTVVRVHVSTIAFHRHSLKNKGLLMTSSSSVPTSLTMTSPVLASLDPVLVDFWSGFPCPPPWNEDLLFRVNWTSCVEQSVGNRLRRYLADRCHIPLPPGILGGEGEGGGDVEGYGSPRERGVACDTSCTVLVSVFSCLFLFGMVVGAFWIWRRRHWRGKEMRGGGQQTTRNGGGDRGRNHYAGIHYASASVVSPERERPLPQRPQADDPMLPRQLHSYVYNPRESDEEDDGDGEDRHHFNKFTGHFDFNHPHLHHPGIHLHLCPLRAAYSAIMPRSCSLEGDELNHHYDYISDLDPARYRSLSSGERGHDPTFCMCEQDCTASRDAGNGYQLLPQYAYPRFGDHLGGYHPPRELDDLDHARQHEISKPFPRYPEDSAGRRFPEDSVNHRHPDEFSVPLGHVAGGSSDVDGDDNVLVTFGGDLSLQNGRNFSTTASGIHPGYLTDTRTHPRYLTDSRLHPRYLTDTRTYPGYLSDSRTHPSYLADSRIHAGASSNENTAHRGGPLNQNRNQFPTISTNSHGTLGRYPANSSNSGGRRVSPANDQNSGRPLREGWGQDSAAPCNNNDNSVSHHVGSSMDQNSTRPLRHRWGQDIAALSSNNNSNNNSNTTNNNNGSRNAGSATDQNFGIPLRDNWGQDNTSPYRSLRASTMTQAVGNVYEDYPQSPIKPVGQRGQGVALQPQFYMDLLHGGGTSSV